MMHVTKQFQHIKIPLEAIISATNNFSNDNCIGNGGFGKVYKGDLIHSKGQTMVAMKRLNRAFGQGDPEFWKEIIMLSRYKHENIVSLLGFCDESDEKILVYEYASKKSLDLYLKSDDLTWIQRLKICIGAARGLAYLHNPDGTQQRVLHRDIKSSNILLDENWNARISDFGLSKFGPANQRITFLVSNAVGTFGYWDPIYAETGVLTKESDVYSFGVVLFEVVSGRLCIDNNNNKDLPLTRWVRQCYKENKVNEIVYGNIKDEIKPKSLKAFAAIAYQCLKRDLEERPLMTKVVRMLERALEYQQGDTNTDDEGIVESDLLKMDGGTSRNTMKQGWRKIVGSSLKVLLGSGTVWFLRMGRKTPSMESVDSSGEEELAIQRLELTKNDLRQTIAKEARGNAIYQASLERRKQALHERRLALEQDVSRHQEQLQAERDLRAALEVGLSMSSGQVSGSRNMDLKTSTELEEIALAEADVARLKQTVAEFHHQLNQQRQHHYGSLFDASD